MVRLRLGQGRLMWGCETSLPGPRGQEARPDPGHHDFSNAERGKFYKPDLRLIPPVRLEPQVLDFLAKRAQAKGTTLNALLNDLLKKDIELIELG